MILTLDCDNTLYPASKGIMSINDERINLYIKQKFGLSDKETNQLRVNYLKQYGTTLRGLMENFGVDPEEYLGFVHNYNLQEILTQNVTLANFLSTVDVPVIGFSSANRAHVENVAKNLGILQFIDDIYDLKRVDYCGKPDLHAYQTLMQDFLGEEFIFVDDRILNFPPARECGMITVYVNETDDTYGENEYSGLKVFREEAMRLASKKNELVDFEIRYIEELASIWEKVKEIIQK